MKRLKTKSSGNGKFNKRPILECLEERALLAGNLTASITYDPAQGAVKIVGTDDRDSLTVSYDTKGTAAVLDDDVAFSVTTAGVTTIERFSRFFPNTLITRVQQVEFEGRGGNDTFGNNTDIRSMVQGGNGDDFLRGGSNQDTFFGGNGNDTILGRDGDDFLTGDADHDLIVGENGNDTISGGEGNDLLAGNDGNDHVAGDNGNDIIDGNDGHDSLDGGEGVDNLDGGDGNDTIHGRGGNDRISGDNGNDSLLGEGGNDLIYGGNGNDRIRGGDGNDSLLGQNDEDDLYGDDGNDLIDGGNHDDLIHGGNHADALFGGAGWDWVYGDGGNDFVTGGKVNFSVYGVSTLGDLSDFSNDYLYGDAGADIYIKTDKVLPLVYLDRIRGNTSEDEVRTLGWINTGTYFDLSTFGHNYTSAIFAQSGQIASMPILNTMDFATSGDGENRRQF